MGDRVPIAVHPGLVSALVGQDKLVATFPVPTTVEEVFLNRGGHGAGDVVTASLRNATGGGGDGIDVTLGDGVEGAFAQGSIEGTSFWLRVTAADANSQNLGGNFLAYSSLGVVTALTTLARVKEYLGIADSTNDALIESVLQGVSTKMQTFMRRGIAEQTFTDQRYDGLGRDRIVLRSWPVIALTAIRESGVVVDSADYYLDEKIGVVFGVDGRHFEYGRKNLGVDYRSGYAVIPPDLSLAATKQAAYEYLQTTPSGQARLGQRQTILDAGGTSQYLTGAWAPGLAEAMLPYRVPALGSGV